MSEFNKKIIVINGGHDRGLYVGRPKWESEH